MRARAAKQAGLLNCEQVAERLQIDVATVRRLVRVHGLPFVRIDDEVRFSEDGLASFIAEHEQRLAPQTGADSDAIAPAVGRDAQRRSRDRARQEDAAAAQPAAGGTATGQRRAPARARQLRGGTGDDI